MIEKYFIKNDLSLRRYRRFKRNRLAVVSAWIFLVMCFLSFTAEFWANSKPIVAQVNGKIIFPIIKDYHPSYFGDDDSMVTDYRAMKFDSSRGDWAAWPLVQWDPLESNTFLTEYPSPPSQYNIFGTDDRGRDVLTRILYGFRSSIIFAFGVWILSYMVGILIGATMGFFGGKIDLVGMRIVEVFQSMPETLILLTLIASLGASMSLLVFFSVIFSWTSMAVYMRAEFLSLRRRDFVDGARALGASRARIIFRHILPNALTPIVTFSPFKISGAIVSLATLEFLGLGLPPPAPSWGELLNQALKYFSIAEWLVWWPSFFLLLTMILLMNIGLAVRDAFDSKTVI